MDSCLKWAWLFPICWFSLLLSIVACKKPPFCDQDSDPFSFLWMIKREPPSYLFGTIHVPYIKVWDNIPGNAKQAFAASSQVFFELDLADPATVSALSTCQMLPQGKNLSDVLPQELYGRLKRHLEYVRGMMPRWITRDKSRGRRIFKGLFNPDQRNFFNADYLFNAIAGNWERKRPVWVMLMVNSLTESDVRSRDVPVLDLYLAQEANRLRKRTAAVEKVEEQCLPLNGLNISQVLFALNQILLQHEEYRREAEHHQHPPPYTTVDLIRHYNCGDLLSGEAVFLGADSLPPLPPLGASAEEEQEGDLARNLDRYLRRELILNRNKRMGERVAKILGSNPGESLFFAFGAGHFIGNNTILDFVQAHGYEIEHLSVNTKIPKSKSKISIRSNTPPKPGLSSYVEGTLSPTRRTGQNRRSNRQRSVAESAMYSRSGASLGLRNAHEGPNAPPVTTPRARCFHDLWVRLDSYGRKKPNTVSGSLQDSGVPKQAFQTWYQKHEDTIHSSASRLVFRYGSSVTVATVLFACSCRTHFHRIFMFFTVTGYT